MQSDMNQSHETKACILIWCSQKVPGKKFFFWFICYTWKSYTEKKEEGEGKW